MNVTSARINSIRSLGMNPAGAGARQATRTPAGVPVRAMGAPSAAAQPISPDQITQSFIDQLKPLFARPNQPAITPFDQSGFYSEGDTRALANSEYDPHAQKEAGYTQSTYDEQRRQDALQRMASDKDRLESVNAAGGFRSSAYNNEQANNTSLRQGQDDQQRQALERILEQQKNDVAGQKEGFVQNRRNEAYQRYLQSIGALTQ